MGGHYLTHQIREEYVARRSDAGNARIKALEHILEQFEDLRYSRRHELAGSRSNFETVKGAMIEAISGHEFEGLPFHEWELKTIHGKLTNTVNLLNAYTSLACRTIINSTEEEKKTIVHFLMEYDFEIPVAGDSTEGST